MITTTSNKYSFGHFLYGKADYIVEFFEKLATVENADKELINIILMVTKEDPSFAAKIVKALQQKETAQERATRLVKDLQETLPDLVDRNDMLRKLSAAKHSSEAAGRAGVLQNLRHSMFGQGYS